MGNFIKAILISAVIVAVLFAFAHHWGGVEVFVDQQRLEPALALGMVMTGVIIALTVTALVLAGLLGSILLFVGIAASMIAVMVFFSGLLLSWPVVIAALVVWLLVRNKNNSNHFI